MLPSCQKRRIRQAVRFPSLALANAASSLSSAVVSSALATASGDSMLIDSVGGQSVPVTSSSSTAVPVRSASPSLASSSPSQSPSAFAPVFPSSSPSASPVPASSPLLGGGPNGGATAPDEVYLVHPVTVTITLLPCGMLPSIYPPLPRSSFIHPSIYPFIHSFIYAVIPSMTTEGR